jgi:hypothetical protein
VINDPNQPDERLSITRHCCGSALRAAAQSRAPRVVADIETLRGYDVKDEFLGCPRLPTKASLQSSINSPRGILNLVRVQVATMASHPGPAVMPDLGA